MPDLQDRIYCSEQIHIPPTFPYIMKLYCKAAIRTQPYDLLKWSAAYFRALANGEEPPVKERVEYPPYDSPHGLTPGYIKVLINQFGKDQVTMVTAQTLFRKWSDVCLDEYLLVKLIALLGASTTVNWVNFVGVCAGFISKTLTQTMILLCELFSDEPEGGMASIPFGLFADLYIFLANMQCGPLTDKEKEELDAIMDEEDICYISEKIRRGEYEGEVGEEYIYGDLKDQGEAAGERGEEDEITSESHEDIEFAKKDFDDMVRTSLEKEDEDVTDIPDREVSGVSFDETGKGDEDRRRTSDQGSAGDQDSVKSGSEREDSIEPSTYEEESTPVEHQEGEKEEEDEEEELTEVHDDKRGLIKLEDLEESVRIRIEEKLGAESESKLGEEDREFEELGSRLLGTATRGRTITPESLGFKVFRKYMRQDLPGIGPPVDSAQVEKVVNFMSFWSDKQERMVMPRNIRHWMCPPLDPLPVPKP